MRKFLKLVVAGILTTALLCGCSISGSPYDNQRNEESRNVSRENGDTDITGTSGVAEREIAGTPSYDAPQSFSYELLKNNIEKNNPVLSPASAYMALSMVGNGAKNDTLSEFREVLGEDMLTTPADMMNKLPRKEDKVKLTLANSAWIDKNVKVDKEWSEKIEKFFLADVYNQELANVKTMEKINKWVDKNTNGLVDGMLSTPLGENDRLVLFNVLYFKADWKRKFDGLSTCESDFYPEDETSCTVDMMRMFDTDLLYVHNDVAEGVVLPYQDEDLVFLALKPLSEGADDVTVREMYEALTWEDISGFLQQEDETLCNLMLPKFRVEFDESLNDSLINMGIVKAFDPAKADLTGLGDAKTGNNIYISLVRQKALVIVDEEGTEAAAVTEVAMCDGAALRESEPVNIYFDKPFLYLIADKNTKVPLFMGIMDCPEY